MDTRFLLGVTEFSKNWVFVNILKSMDLYT